MAYSAIVKPSLNFNTVTYTGNGGTQTISGVGFQPDFSWVKGRDYAYYHYLQDSIRGSQKILYTNNTDSEGTITAGISTWNADGYVTGSQGALNYSGRTFVAWNWKAGSAVSGTTTGSGTSKSYTGSVNAAAGFSIIGYGGNGTAGHTIPHNLSATPDAIIVKNRSAAWNWSVYHKDAFTSQAAPGVLYLNTTAAKANDTNVWGNSSVTINSTVFSLGDYEGTNKDGSNLVAYCFAEKKGYSKFGSYTGNGNADGPFIYTGFKPAFFMTKRTDVSAGWQMYDGIRDVDNPADHRLQAQSTAVELVGDANTYIDFLSNGFKLKNADSDSNASGGTYIYMAFAENPLVANSGTDGVPATAR